jgi:ABC-type phosphate transport system substrate-binding protein
VYRKFAKRLLASACSVLLWALLCAGPARAEDSVAVITSPDRDEPALSRAKLQAIYLMRVRQWPDGTPIRVFVLPESSAVHDRFAREKLGTYPYILRRAWDRLVFTGGGLAPEVVYSEEEMRQKVLNSKGAIGYLSVGPRSQLYSFVLATDDRKESEHAHP